MRALLSITVIFQQASILLGSLVASKDLQATQMGVFAVLMILKDADLEDEAAEQRSLAPVYGVEVFILVVLDGTDLGKVDGDPTARLLELHVCEFYEVVKASAGPELHAGRCVTLVVLKVEVDADVSDGDLFEEMYGEEVRLRAITLPEEG